MTEAVHGGGCICGAVRFETRGPPARVTVCHCRWCQRATGSAYMVEPVFDLDAFAVTRGEPARYDHRSAGSGALVHVHFCARCGTKTHLTFERFAGAVGVYAGTFDEPDWIEVRPGEAKHIFLAVARPETVLPAGSLHWPDHARALDGTLRDGSATERPTEARDLR